MRCTQNEEADHPGPGRGLDDSEPSSSDQEEPHPLPGDMDWRPSDLDDDFEDFVTPVAPEQPATTPPAADAWLRKHAGKSFVPVRGPSHREIQVAGGEFRVGLQTR